MELRNYQKKAINHILTDIKNWTRLLCLVMATGTWKTVVFTNIMNMVKQKWKKVLLLAHREELLNQAKNTLNRNFPEISCSIEQGLNIANPDDDVVLASVATLWRTWSDRIKKFKKEDFWLIIIDEFHRGVADTYLNVLDYFWANKKTWLSQWHPVVLWVTATPSRRDNIWLDEVVEKISFTYNIKEAIKDWYLVNVKAFSIYTWNDLDQVTQRAWDFAIEELWDAVNNEARNNLIVDTYKDLCLWEKTICFCVNVQHSKDLRDCFKKHWIRAESIYWALKGEDRKSILKDFSEWKIDVLLNVWVLIEWYDEPWIRNVLMTRPTTSGVIFNQAIGRWTRLFPWKEFVRVIDFVDNLTKNQLVTSSSLIWAEKPMKFNWENPFDYEDKVEELMEKSPWTDLSTVDLNNIDKVIKEVDLFKMAQISDFVKSMSKNSWIILSKGFRLYLWAWPNWNNIVASITEDTLGAYDIQFIEMIPKQKGAGWRWMFDRSILYEEKVPSKISALEKADSYIFHNYRSNLNLTKQSAGWRKEPPTERQINMLKRFGYKQWLDNLSKWDAAVLITRFMSEKK